MAEVWKGNIDVVVDGQQGGIEGPFPRQIVICIR